jgi:hypothetical protein
MGFVPLLSWLYAEVSSAFPEDELSNWSRSGTIGQVEADFFGGDGYQTASLWRDGKRIWGPSHTWEFSAPRHEWPINAVLAQLGIVLEPRDVRPEYYDLFVEVGLAAERDHEGWSRHALGARNHATYDDWHAARQAEREAAERETAERDKYARLPDVSVPLDGKEVMQILGIPSGRQVGAAIRFLQNLHAGRGDLSREDAVAALRSWGAEAPRTADDE